MESPRATPRARRPTQSPQRSRNAREIKPTSASAHPLAHRTTPRATPARGIAPTRRTARPPRADAPGRRFTRRDATRVAEIVTTADISTRRIFLQRIHRVTRRHARVDPVVFPRFRCASMAHASSAPRVKKEFAILLLWLEIGWNAGSPFPLSLRVRDETNTNKTFSFPRRRRLDAR